MKAVITSFTREKINGGAVKTASLHQAKMANPGGDAERHPPGINGDRDDTTAHRHDEDVIFHIYLREIRVYRLLSRTEEVNLARRLQRGDKQARQQMILCNLRLVVKIAREFEGFGLSLLDLISEGNIGLMRAVERFDPDRGTRLSTYAAYYIKQGMRRAIHNQSRVIRLPIHIHERLLAMHKASLRLHEELGRDPSDAELARVLGLKPRMLEKCRVSALCPVSLQESLEVNEARSNEEIVGDDNAILPGRELEMEESHAALRSVLPTLSEREQLILRLRFGFHNCQKMTLDEVSAQLGLTRERIRQIEYAALRKLRLRLQARERITA